MIYATLADMQKAYSVAELTQLTDVAGTGQIDADLVQDALVSASSMVEGYVAATYDLDPALPVPQLLIDVTCDIARYRLYKQTAPENAVQRYRDAMQTLRDIRSGKVKLDAGVETLPAREGQILMQSNCGTMTRDRLRGW